MIKKFTQVLTLLGILIFIEFQNLYSEARLYLHKKYVGEIWTVAYNLVDSDELQITTIDTKERLEIPLDLTKELRITTPDGYYAIFPPGKDNGSLPLQEEANYEIIFSPDNDTNEFCLSLLSTYLS